MAVITYFLPLAWLVVLALQFRQRRTHAFTFSDVAVPTLALVFELAINAAELFVKGAAHG